MHRLSNADRDLLHRRIAGEIRKQAQQEPEVCWALAGDIIDDIVSKMVADAYDEGFFAATAESTQQLGEFSASCVVRA